MNKLILLALIFALLIVSSSQVFAIATAEMHVACSVNNTAPSCRQTARINCSIIFPDPWGEGISYVNIWLNNEISMHTAPTTGNRTVGSWIWDITPQIGDPLYYMFNRITVVPYKVGVPIVGYSPLILCSNKDSTPAGTDHHVPGCIIDFTPYDGIEIYPACSCTSPSKISGNCTPNSTSVGGGYQTTYFIQADPSCQYIPSFTVPCDYCDPQWTTQYTACLNNQMSLSYYSANPSCCAATGAASDCNVPSSGSNNKSCMCTGCTGFAPYVHSISNPSVLVANSQSSLISDIMDYFPLNGSYQQGWQPVVKDFDLDGRQEVVVFNSTSMTIYRFANGWSKILNLPIPGGTIVGQPGVYYANLLIPVRNSTTSSIQIYEYTGTFINSFTLTGDVNQSGFYCEKAFGCFIMTKTSQNYIAYETGSFDIKSVNINGNLPGYDVDFFNTPTKIKDVSSQRDYLLWQIAVNNSGSPLFTYAATDMNLNIMLNASLQGCLNPAIKNPISYITDNDIDVYESVDYCIAPSISCSNSVSFAQLRYSATGVPNIYNAWDTASIQ
jgi:hypothetical protein